MTARESLPTNLAAAHVMILAERAARVDAEARLADARSEAANAQAELSSTEAFISHLKLEAAAARARAPALRWPRAGLVRAPHIAFVQRWVMPRWAGKLSRDPGEQYFSIEGRRSLQNRCRSKRD